jgi:hypothetical protein
VVPVARDGRVDETGVVPAERLVGEAEPRQGPGAEVLEEDVGPAGQPAHQGLPIGVLQVDRDRALVAVGGQEVGRLPGHEGRAVAARVVAAVGLLHLEDARPEVREEHGGEGAGHDAGEVEDGDVVERKHVEKLPAPGGRVS